MKIKLIDHADLVDKMNQKHGNLYSAGVIKAGTYPNQDKDNHQTNVWNVLIANAKMSDQMAYDITKTMYDKKADWVAVHREANELNLANQSASRSGVPYHPGALKYYAEKGVKVQ